MIKRIEEFFEEVLSKEGQMINHKKEEESVFKDMTR